MRRHVQVIVFVIGGTLSCGMGSAFAQGPATLESLLDIGRESEPQSEAKPRVEPVATRLPVPPNDDVAAARDLIRQAYEEYYAQVSKSPRRLVDKLLQTADEVEDGTRRYALLVEAEQAAIDAGDIDAAIEASSLRSRYFQVDPLACRLDVLIAASQIERRDDMVIFRMFADLADEAIAAAQLNVAEKASAEALATGKRVERSDRIAAAEERKRTGRKPQGNGKAPALLEEAAALQRQVKDRRKAVAEYDAALETLKQKPEDPAANGVVGRYRCFVTGDWGAGLRSLGASDSESLRKAAGEELRMQEEKQPKPERLLAVAGSWWKLAEAGGIAPAEAEAVKRHAATMYQKALPDITDPIERTLARKRVAAIDIEADRPSPKVNPGGGKVPARRPGAPLRIPASALLPAPADLSLELVALLPTEAEVATLQNHVNIADHEVDRAKNGFLQRVYQGFGIERWSTIDALYVIELNDRMNELLGEQSVQMPGGGSASGSRGFCKSLLASRWLLASKSEQDFVRRMRSLPPDLARSRELDWGMHESVVKRWLMSLGPEYSSTRRKLQAIDHLIQEGITSQAVRSYREELTRAVEGTRP